MTFQGSGPLRATRNAVWIDEDGQKWRSLGNALLVHEPGHPEAPRGPDPLQDLHPRRVPDLRQLRRDRGRPGRGHPDGLRRRDGRADHVPGQAQPRPVRDRRDQQAPTGDADDEEVRRQKERVVNGEREVNDGTLGAVIRTARRAGPTTTLTRSRQALRAIAHPPQAKQPHEDRAQGDHGPRPRRGLRGQR